MYKLVSEESSGSVCAGSKPQTDPEYSARGPSSLPILMIAWSMPRYRISRYLLSPTWPWTWSRVLAKSMGKVPETLKSNRFFYKTGSRSKGFPNSSLRGLRAGVCSHHSPHSAVTEASPPKTKGFQLTLDMSSSSGYPNRRKGRTKAEDYKC